jgi:hypothetical protein
MNSILCVKRFGKLIAIEILDYYVIRGGVRVAWVVAIEGKPFITDDRWPKLTEFAVVGMDEIIVSQIEAGVLSSQARLYSSGGVQHG